MRFVVALTSTGDALAALEVTRFVTISSLELARFFTRTELAHRSKIVILESAAVFDVPSTGGFE